VVKEQVFRIFLLVSLCLCVSAVQIFSQDWKTVHNGVEYAQVEKEISGLKVKMNLLRLDLKKVRLDVHHALEKAIGLETTSSIALRHGGVAAINSGFFRLDKSEWAGDAAGILVIDKELLSESLNNRIALVLYNLRSETYARFQHLESRNELRVSDNQPLRILGVNREIKSFSDLVVYTPRFHSSTLTKNVLEVIVRKGKVIEVLQNGGNARIPADGFVISATGDQISKLNGLKPGVRLKELRLMPPFSDELRGHGEWFTTEDITNGVPQLIKNGKVDITWEQEKTTKSFVETRHPRTAVAKLKDGKFLMITVDGRSESSGGLSLYDLADYLLSIGAVDAMNLDGGGSTTMFLDGKVVNTPSDKEGERKVGDAIVVTLRMKNK
jgi:hypothetical protein